MFPPPISRMPTDFALLTLVKYPEPGKVKTRLAVALGEQLACDLYHFFVLATLEKNKQLPEAAHYVAFTPAERRRDFQNMFADDSFWFPQIASADLGQRIHHAVKTVLARGHRGVLTLGSDSPSLPVQYLREAVRALREYDLVLGPAEDGGYYLIGLKSTPVALFENIAWSTCQVFAQTRAAAQGLGLSVSILPEWYDVDEETTLRKYCQTEVLPQPLAMELQPFLRQR